MSLTMVPQPIPQPTATFLSRGASPVGRPPIPALGTALSDLQLSVTPPLVALLVAGLATVLALLAGIRRLVPDDSLVTALPDALGGDAAAASGTDIPPDAHLTEEERFVVDLLRRNDGRLRQSKVVEASDWSKSKVSRLLSAMEAEGYVEKVAVGRENIIALPGEEPEP